MGSGYNGEKGLFPHLGGGYGNCPPQHGTYPPQGYNGYSTAGGYPQVSYPPYGGYPPQAAGGYPPTAYPGSSAPYHHSGYWNFYIFL